MNTIIIFLAYAHRYVYPISIVLVTVILDEVLEKNVLLLSMGIGFLLLAAYDLIGYKRRWKHIYCSLQNANRQKMTPNHIHWSDVKKSEVYGSCAVSGILGIAMIVCHILWA